MQEKQKNYSVTDIGSFESLSERKFSGATGTYSGKYFIGEALGLTGCEVSLNRLPAGQGMPFVHAHKKNEEVYIVLNGNGIFFVDGEEFQIHEGSLIRVAPEGARALKAGDEDLYFICIQAEADSLSQATFADGIKVDCKTSWLP